MLRHRYDNFYTLSSMKLFISWHNNISSSSGLRC